MEAFLDSATDSYAILQLRRCDETLYERFASMKMLEHMGKEPDIDHYEVVYVGELPQKGDQMDVLEGLYVKFNIDRPEDFRGHSLSVSDIVALQVGGVVSSHYVDSIGFAELPDFISRENYLKNAEMALEDDFGMLDGIINNGDRQEPERPLHSGAAETALSAPPAGSSREKNDREGRTMTRFNREERFLMMLYNPGTRTGLIGELQGVRSCLTPGERKLRKLIDRTLEKLSAISDQEFDALELYPEI